ncbi:MAG: hypothetical protein PIR02_06265 [Microbacterium enclense]
MASQLVDDAIAQVSVLAEVLDSVGAARYAEFFARLEGDLRHASDPSDIREAVHRGLAMYGGMNTFNDYVVMSGNTPDVESNRRIDQLRTAVYECLLRLAA